MDKTFADYGIEGIDMHRAGEQYTTCPKCSPSRRHKTNRCLSANAEKKVWRCHQCGRYGSLARGWSDDPAWSSKREFLTPDFTPEEYLPEQVTRFFAGRKISMDSVKALGVSYHPQIYFGELKGVAPAICFPFYRNGSLVNVKYRANGKKFRLEAGAQRIFYNMDGCFREKDGKQEQWPWCVIVEGEMDALAVHTCGIRNVLSVPDGAPDVKAKNYTSKFDFLENCEEFLAGFQEVFIAVDRDEPGRKLEEELARRIGMERCKRVEWPTGCKDANEVLIKYGREYLQDYILNNATEFPVSGVFTVKMLESKIVNYYEHGLPRGVESGIPELDKLYRPTPGHLVVITGTSWSGKSTFWDWYMMQFAKKHDWHGLICSPENMPLEMHMTRMITRFVNLPFNEGPYARMTEDDLKRGMDFVHEHFTWILPDPEEGDMTLERILDRMEIAVLRTGAKMAVIDPWNEIDHDIPHGMTETNYVSYALKKMRQFARSRGVEFALVAHPTKMAKDFRTGKRAKKPFLDDISGSGHFRNKADIGIVISREDNVTEVDLQKVRFEEHGQKGSVKFTYDLITKNFSIADAATIMATMPNNGQLGVMHPATGEAF